MGGTHGDCPAIGKSLRKVSNAAGEWALTSEEGETNPVANACGSRSIRINPRSHEMCPGVCNVLLLCDILLAKATEIARSCVQVKDARPVHLRRCA